MHSRSAAAPDARRGDEEYLNGIARSRNAADGAAPPERRDRVNARQAPRAPNGLHPRRLEPRGGLVCRVAAPRNTDSIPSSRLLASKTAARSIHPRVKPFGALEPVLRADHEAERGDLEASVERLGADSDEQIERVIDAKGRSEADRRREPHPLRR